MLLHSKRFQNLLVGRYLATNKNFSLCSPCLRGDPSLMTVASSIKQPGHENAARKKANHGDEAAYRKLKRTAQPMAARSTVGKARAEHGDQASNKGCNGTERCAGSEAPFPHAGDGLPLVGPGGF